jgi:hypothetical protein
MDVYRDLAVCLLAVVAGTLLLPAQYPLHVGLVAGGQRLQQLLVKRHLLVRAEFSRYDEAVRHDFRSKSSPICVFVNFLLVSIPNSP